MLPKPSILFALAFIPVVIPAAVPAADDFAIKDGDTVVFLGDSITAAREYGKIIENYTLLRYPGRKVRFINAGIGGDTAAGGLKRLERDVFANHATLLTVAYGINDIGWGTKADEEHKRLFLDSIQGIVKACKKQGVRVYICSAAVTGSDPNKSENDYLQKMCDEGMALSRSLGGNAIDVQRTMRAIQKKIWSANASVADKSKHDSLHVFDGVHLNDLGQLAMAYAILKGLGAPANVSAVAIDAAQPKLLKASGCAVTDLAKKGGVLEFTRLDDGLPFNYGTFFPLNFRYVPVSEELNRYILTVANLPKGEYEVIADGRSAGIFSSDSLGAGANISSSTPDGWQPGGPWNAQADVLKKITEARHHLASATTSANEYLPNSSATERLGRQFEDADERIVTMQRDMARPVPYRFVIKPHVAPTAKGAK